MVEPMPENYDLSDRNSPGIEKSLAAKRVATPLMPIHLLSQSQHPEWCWNQSQIPDLPTAHITGQTRMSRS